LNGAAAVAAIDADGHAASTSVIAVREHFREFADSGSNTALCKVIENSLQVRSLSHL
jgi:hypothetical protein